jgi:hypothetical protein
LNVDSVLSKGVFRRNGFFSSIYSTGFHSHILFVFSNIQPPTNNVEKRQPSEFWTGSKVFTMVSGILIPIGFDSPVPIFETVLLTDSAKLSGNPVSL